MKLPQHEKPLAMQGAHTQSRIQPQLNDSVSNLCGTCRRVRFSTRTQILLHLSINFIVCKRLHYSLQAPREQNPLLTCRLFQWVLHITAFGSEDQLASPRNVQATVTGVPI